LEALEQRLGESSATRSSSQDLEKTVSTQHDDAPDNIDTEAEQNQASLWHLPMKRKHEKGSQIVAETALTGAEQQERRATNTVRFEPGTVTIMGGMSQPLAMHESPQLSIPGSTSTGDAQPVGTLMIDKGGRSKYLGPTAGSDWLKDVSENAHIWADMPARDLTYRFPSDIAYGLSRAA